MNSEMVHYCYVYATVMRPICTFWTIFHTRVHDPDMGRSIQVKGKDAKIDVWVPLTIREVTEGSERSRLVGRDSELSILWSYLDLRRRIPEKSLRVMLRGEAGMGKSSLLAEVSRVADITGFRVIRVESNGLDDAKSRMFLSMRIIIAQLVASLSRRPRQIHVERLVSKSNASLVYVICGDEVVHICIWPYTGALFLVSQLQLCARGPLSMCITTT